MLQIISISKFPLQKDSNIDDKAFKMLSSPYVSLNLMWSRRTGLTSLKQNQILTISRKNNLPL